jgi:hypothetical protein
MFHLSLETRWQIPVLATSFSKISGVPVSLSDYRVLTQQVRKFTVMRSEQIDRQGSNLVVFICSERTEKNSTKIFTTGNTSLRTKHESQVVNGLNLK